MNVNFRCVFSCQGIHRNCQKIHRDCQVIHRAILRPFELIFVKVLICKKKKNALNVLNAGSVFTALENRTTQQIYSLESFLTFYWKVTCATCVVVKRIGKELEFRVEKRQCLNESLDQHC